MITRTQIKIDLFGQGGLLLFLLICWLFTSMDQLSAVLLILLTAWQLLSAWYLLTTFRYAQKLNYLKLYLVIGLAIPWWYTQLGILIYLPLAILIAGYFLQTIRDALIVYRRPRTFWDL